MIPAGYLYKRIVAAAPAVTVPGVIDVYSVSNCVNDDFARYVDFWRHNGFWLFDSPSVMQQLAAEHRLSLDGLTLCYYEVYEQRFDLEGRWVTFAADPSFDTAVVPPDAPTLVGFDVVTSWAGGAPEHSPLSCNDLAAELPVNEHCLFATLDEAIRALQDGRFKDGEPGPWQIFAVYTVAEPAVGESTPE